MYLFILTRKDGTPFDVTSVSEEDIVEMCTRLGHTHPMGVLCYLVMELVALFHSREDMQLRQQSYKMKPLPLGLWPLWKPMPGYI